LKVYKKKDKQCIDCNKNLYMEHMCNPWINEQGIAKDKWIERLLKACEYLSKDREVPEFVKKAMEE